MVVRLPRLPAAANMVDKEQQWLPRLGQLLPLAVPEPLGKGAPDDGFPYPWSVYRWLPCKDLADQPDVDLTAVIDFGLLGFGRSGLRHAAAWTLLTAETRAVFRAESGVDAATWVRGAAGR